MGNIIALFVVFVIGLLIFAAAYDVNKEKYSTTVNLTGALTCTGSYLWALYHLGTFDKFL